MSEDKFKGLYQKIERQNERIDKLAAMVEPIMDYLVVAQSNDAELEKKVNQIEKNARLIVERLSDLRKCESLASDMAIQIEAIKKIRREYKEGLKKLVSQVKS